MAAPSPAPTDLDPTLRPTHLVVDLDQLAANVATVRARVRGRQVLGVLKANAYGHGLVPVGRLYERLGVDLLAVAYLEEGVVLRRAGIRTPILVMGGLVDAQIPRFLEHDLILTASSVDKLAAIEAAAEATGRRARVHLAVDTGMERIGVHWYSAAPLLEAAVRARHVRVEGIYSHLANADAADPSHAREQVARFEAVLDQWDRLGKPRPTAHLANSGAVAHLPEAWFDLVRPGLLLYGIQAGPDVPTVPVQGALRWVSRVVYFKVVKAGNPVSYGSTWRPERMSRVVTVPVGYGDGYARALSNRAFVLIGGRRYPVVGRVCMDMVMVDIGWESAWNGDEVVLLGAQGPGRITVEEHAAWSDTVAYEVLTRINDRVPRVYVGEHARALGLETPSGGGHLV
jgi:alanine racemase